MSPADLAERTRTLPPPVRAGIELVATGVERASHVSLPGVGDLAGLPRRGLTLLTTARHLAGVAYTELTERGEQVVAKWRHTDHAPAVPAQPAAEKADAVEAAAAAVEGVVDPFGLPDDVVELVEEAPPGATLSHDQLPLEDYDHLTLGSLRARLARLDAVALVQLRDYERTHAHRLPVLTMLENRLAKIGNATQ
jgi:hypothetical protein